MVVKRVGSRNKQQQNLLIINSAIPNMAMHHCSLKSWPDLVNPKFNINSLLAIE